MAEEKSSSAKAAEDKKEEIKEASKKPEKPQEEIKKEEKKSEQPEDKNFPELSPGMTVRIYQKIKELNIKGEEKERTQYFEGMIISKKHGQEAGGTITVRKVSNGVGVEKIFPLKLPTIEKIEVKKKALVRRAKLSFLKKGYKKKLREKQMAK